VDGDSENRNQNSKKLGQKKTREKIATVSAKSRRSTVDKSVSAFADEALLEFVRGVVGEMWPQPEDRNGNTLSDDSSDAPTIQRNGRTISDSSDSEISTPQRNGGIIADDFSDSEPPAPQRKRKANVISSDDDD